MRLRLLRRKELPVASAALARFLIGKFVVREARGTRMVGRIVETEAYPPGDLAAHHVRGKTQRNASLFARPGTAYVYFAYGSSWMLNVASEPEGVGGGVLFRALEPIEGIERMQRNRGTQNLRDLARGPGRLAQALEVDNRFDGIDLCAKGPIWLAAASGAATTIGTSVRIGISKDAHRRLRFFAPGSPFVSGTRKLNTQDDGPRDGM
jgi:DNA-3-methyladenine glycosylase